jgi:hypothetical protein
VGQFEIAYCSPIASVTAASAFGRGNEWPGGSPGQAPAGGLHDEQQPLSLPQPAPTLAHQFCAQVAVQEVEPVYISVSAQLVPTPQFPVVPHAPLMTALHSPLPAPAPVHE